MAPPNVQLVVKSGPVPGKTYPVEKDEVYIGRDVTNDVVINDAEVSRRHARLTLRSGSYVLEDLGSTNGTFVNGQRLTRPTIVRPGDAILLGENVSLAMEMVAYDADATLVSAAPPVEPAPPPPPPPVREPYVPPAPPPPPPAEPAYAGRVPPSPYEPVAPEEARPARRTWLWVGCGCLVVLLCAAVGAGLWYVDTNLLWCDLMPFLPGCPTF